MTNLEAVAYIREWLKDEYALNDKDREVLNTAVEALEQEPMRKKGKPIFDIDSPYWSFDRPLKCPFCNIRFDYSVLYYCPNCGAEMAESESK